MGVMSTFTLKEKTGIIVLTALSAAMMIIAIYGFSLSEFVYLSKRTSYCFSGANRILFSSALLFLGLLFFAMCCFSYLYMLGLVKKREPNSISNAVVVPLFLVPLIGIIITSIIAMLSCP